MKRWNQRFCPLRYPNLLVNGITGIAAGYATNIPPHNLNEVVDAAIYRIQHPQCDFIRINADAFKGPDFPTGGIVMGIEGVKEAFSKGKGKLSDTFQGPCRTRRVRSNNLW